MYVSWIALKRVLDTRLTGCRRFTAIDMADNDDVNVHLFLPVECMYQYVLLRWKTAVGIKKC